METDILGKSCKPLTWRRCSDIHGAPCCGKEFIDVSSLLLPTPAADKEKEADICVPGRASLNRKITNGKIALSNGTPLS